MTLLAMPPSSNSGSGATGPVCTTCNRTFSTDALLKQHVRRGNCKGNMVLDNHPCEICSRTFSTFAGVRQHIRRAHRVTYNEELATTSTLKRRAWTVDEQKELAKLEAEMESDDVTAIIDHLASNSSRSRDAIKKRRQRRSFIEEVKRIRQSMTDEAAIVEIPEAPELDFTRNSEAEEEYRNVIQNLQLSSEDELLRSSLLSSSTNVKELLDSWLVALLKKYGKTRRRPASSFQYSAPPSRGQSNRKKRAALYRFSQRLFEHDRKKLAKMVIDGNLGQILAEEPSVNDIKGHFSEIFSVPSVPVEAPITDTFSERTTVSDPITAEEIGATIGSMKSNTAGPDGISLRVLKQIHRDKLALLFNAMLFLEYTPLVLKRSRTILIPKGSNLERSRNLSNWRPITISSVLVRVLHKILTSRLDGLALHGNQRGFNKVDGCLANTLSLHTIIKHHRSKGRPLCVISLDISKAFDTVSHNGLTRALRRANLDKKFVSYVKNNLTDAMTRFETNNGSVDISVQRGVKQGDPLSPRLFNIVLDELICAMDDFEGI